MRRGVACTFVAIAAITVQTLGERRDRTGVHQVEHKQQKLDVAPAHNESLLKAQEVKAKKLEYVKEKMAIEHEVVAPFVAKANTIPAADTEGKQKVAFIFLTMRDLAWPGLWQSFFEEAPAGDYSIYVHQAAVKDDSAREQHPLPLSKFGAIAVPWVRTAWCALFGVEVATLFEALRDPRNSQFVFISDSTIPLKNFAYVHQELMEVAPTSSRVCLAEAAKYRRVIPEMITQETTQGCFFRDFLREINPRAMKHHQWLTLARRHAQAIVENAAAALIIYEGVWAEAAPDVDMGEGCSDEAVPVIAILNSLDAAGRSSGNTWTDLTRLGVEQDCLTYVRWRNCFKDSELDMTSMFKDLKTAWKNAAELTSMIGGGSSR
mmetsp:Transcript_37824/g.67412  ORF Transcript_37824/g.67412 Transcript_37824/m.67412 type:complete len:377 (-) Transcript_37824:9-1139(-)